VGETFDLFGTKETPEPQTLFGCIGTEPTSLMIPTDAPPGIYALTVSVSVEGESGEVQNIVRTSGVFEVLASASDNP
jgi:hypothetical protein